MDSSHEASEKAAFGISDFVKVKETEETVLITGKNGDMYTVKNIQGNESEVAGEDIEPTESVYKIPVTWEMCGEIKVKASSAREAINRAWDSLDSIDLPEGEYVDESLTLSERDSEFLCSYIYLYQ